MAAPAPRTYSPPPSPPLSLCPLCPPPRGPVSMSVLVSVMGSHLAPLSSACLVVSIILGRMVFLEESWAFGARGRQDSTQGPQASPDPECEPYLDTEVDTKYS